MKNFFANKYLLLIIRVVLGFVFVYAGLEKALMPESFAKSISNYQLLPELIINFFAIILPWIEIVCGILLIFGITVKENSMILSLLLSIFIIMITVSIIRGLNIDCGCFGTTGGTKVGVAKIIENIVLLAIGGHLVKYDSTFLSLNKNS